MKFTLQFNCPKQWSDMAGDDTIRLCSACDKQVHNLSELSEQQATTILHQKDTCVTLKANQHGEIRTASGFSRSLLLMGLAVGCSDQANTPSQTTTNTSIDLVDEFIGEIEPDCTNTKDTTPPPDEQDPKDAERPFTGKIRPPSVDKEQNKPVAHPTGTESSASGVEAPEATEKNLPPATN